jgi:Ca2+-binding RTX toxin-like protein
MAKLKAYKALDLESPPFLYGDLVSSNASRITISDGTDTSIYYGSFRYSAYGLTGGTVTGYDGYDNGTLAVRVRGASVNVLTLNSYLDYEDIEGAYALALRRNDSIFGSAHNDTLRGFGGSDMLQGGAGNDYLQGDGGSDVLKGGPGNDYLQGDDDYLLDDGDIDRLKGGKGADVLIWDRADFFDGGRGFDTLEVDWKDINLTTVASDKLINIEQIDLGVHCTLKLTAADVLDMSPTNQVKILGWQSGFFNEVDIEGSFTVGAASGGFVTYILEGGATLLVERNIDVY